MKIDSSLAAVVTGGASGPGLATVKALRAAGAAVAIFDRNEDGCQGGCRYGRDLLRLRRPLGPERRSGLPQGSGRTGTGKGARVLCGRRQRDTHGSPRQEDRRDQRLSVGSVRMGSAPQHRRHVPLHHSCGGGDDDTRADRWRAGRYGQYRLGGGDGWTDRSGRLRGGQGRHRRHDLAHRTRSVARGDTHRHDPARHFATPAMAGASPQMLESLSAMVPFPKRLGHPRSMRASPSR